LNRNIFEYDIAHCHFGPCGDLAAILKDLGAFTGKIVTTFYGEAGYTKQKEYKSGLKNLFRNRDIFLPMSHEEKENLIELGCGPKKIVVHTVGVDTSRFVFPTDKSRDHTHNIRLLTVGRLVEKREWSMALGL